MLLSVLALLLAVACRDAPFSPDAAEPGAPAVHDLSAGTLLASTDFSEYAESDTLGVKPQDWTERWSAGGVSWKAWADSSGAFQGHAKLLNYVGGGARHAVSWDGIGTPANVRLHTRVRMSSIDGGWMAGLVVAGGGSGHHSATGYSWHFKNMPGLYGVELRRFVNGQGTLLGEHSLAFQPDTFYHLVLEKSGTALRAKVWKDGEPEPAGWQVEATDTVLSSGWAGFSNYDEGIFEYDFLEVYDPEANPVPAQAPDTFPAWMLHRDNIVPYKGHSVVYALRNIVGVLFRPGTPQAERQEAVDLIGGEVVGGRPIQSWPEGRYYVQIAGDSTGEAASAAADLVETLPQVSSASPVFMAHPDSVQHWRLPNDGQGFERSEWQVRFDPTQYPTPEPRLTEYLELIDAPLAWGCSTGDENVPIAVVDNGFAPLPDLMPNVDLIQTADTITSDHGTSVAAILGARGSNGMGVTGVMWYAGMRLYDHTIDPATGQPYPARGETVEDLAQQILYNITDRVRTAGAGGARVINLSLGTPEVAALAQTQEDVAAEWADELRGALRDLAAAGFRPLVVVSAGNENTDASVVGFPRLATETEFSGQVLAVAAALIGSGDGQVERWDLSMLGEGSNYGTLVEIAAPGVLRTLTASGSGPELFYGTSAAAPVVTGAAGLLFSFDPNLTSEQVKILLLEGAQRGDHSISDPDGNVIPVLNVRESLKAAAERSGAPLCGNKVWAADGQLHVRRTAGVVETLAPLASVPVGQVEVLHGGKHILYLAQQGQESLAWSAAGGWAPGAPPPGLPRGGTTASVFGRSHGQDSLAYLDADLLVGTRWYETQNALDVPVLLKVGADSAQPIGTLTVEDFDTPVRETCLERNPTSGFCYFSIVESRLWIPRLSYPQLGTDLYLSVSPLHHVEIASTAWAPCSFNAAHECRAVQSLQQHAAAQVHTMSLDPATLGSVAFVDSLPNEALYWMGQSETGEGLVLGDGLWRVTFWADAVHYYQTGSPFHDFVQILEHCEIEYRPKTAFLSPSDSIPTLHACYSRSDGRLSTGAGNGTIAPSLAPTRSSELGRANGGAGEAVALRMPLFEVTPEGLKPMAP